ncbi:hypothetical protein ACFOPP_09355 [Sphingobium sp. GCM10012300]
MIETIAKRRITLNGTTHQKGATIQMPLQQFNDLEPTGMVERAPAKSSPKARARKPAAKPVAAKPVAPAPAAAPVSQPGADKAD